MAIWNELPKLPPKNLACLLAPVKETVPSDYLCGYYDGNRWIMYNGEFRELSDIKAWAAYHNYVNSLGLII